MSKDLVKTRCGMDEMDEEIGKISKRFGLEVEFQEVEVSKLLLDERVRWKCMFGCESYGKKSCPPFVPAFDECVRFVKSYRNGILFKFRIKSKEDLLKAQKFMLEVEKTFSKVSRFALATFPGGCVLCENKCAENCILARPSLSALCVDVIGSGIELRESEVAALLFLDEG